MGKEAKANAERGNEKIHVDWRAIQLVVHRSDKGELAGIAPFGPPPPGASDDDLRERAEEILRVRAAKQTVLAYVNVGQGGRMTGRDAKEYFGPLRDDLENDEPTAIVQRRHLDWALRWLGNDELTVASSCAGWREPVHAHLRARLDESAGGEGGERAG